MFHTMISVRSVCDYHPMDRHWSLVYQNYVFGPEFLNQRSDYMTSIDVFIVLVINRRRASVKRFNRNDGIRSSIIHVDSNCIFNRRKWITVLKKVDTCVMISFFNIFVFDIFTNRNDRHFLILFNVDPS